MTRKPTPDIFATVRAQTPDDAEATTWAYKQAKVGA